MPDPQPRVTPARFNWLLDGDRGKIAGEVTLPPDDVLQTVINLKGDDETGTLVTASLFARVRGALAGGDILRTRAVIRWGVGGRAQEATIDVLQGTVISVPASYLRVDMANESLPSGTGPTVIANATVGYLPRGGPHRITRTVYFGGVGVAATVNAAIPAWADAVTYLRQPNGSAYTLRILDSNGNVVYNVNVAAAADAPFHLPLSNDAFTLSIVDGGAGITNSRAIFDLAL